MRFKQVDEGVTTFYSDKLYEEEINGTKNTWRAYIDDIAVISQTTTEGATIRYTHRDRLGSARVFTDHNGQVEAQRNFDPFGKPRLASGDLMAYGNSKLADLDEAKTRRGFTDHEHLDDVELIHMNGRVYDYNLGRFMSVDPFIQSPTNSQSINPYSYIMNNPMAGIDPTGYLSVCDTFIVCTNEQVRDKNFNKQIKLGNSGKVSNGYNKGENKNNNQQNVEDIGAPSTTEKQAVTDIKANAEKAVSDGHYEGEELIIHKSTGNNSPDYYKDDGTPVWITNPHSEKNSKVSMRSASRTEPRVKNIKGYWREIGRVYGKGSKGTFIGSRKVKLNFFDEQGLALANGIYFSIDYQQLGKDGKPIPTISSKSHGQLMKALPMGLTYELYGGSVERFSWHIETKSSAASCDNCGAGGIIVSEFIYE